MIISLLGFYPFDVPICLGFDLVFDFAVGLVAWHKAANQTGAAEKDVLSLRTSHQYERPLYWAGQLFYEDFDTSPVHVVEELDEEGR